MKTLSSVCEDYKKSLKDEPKLVHFIATSTGYKELETPKFSNELYCEFCDCEFGYTPLMDTNDSRRVWMCGNVCSRSKLPNHRGTVQTPPVQRRAQEWAKFCEINGLGDVNHDIKFENIEQSDGKISYMLKFVATPRGILHMQGEPGTGKTYAALAMCELYTRKDSYCIFTTQKQMSNNWLATFNKDQYSNYIERVTNCNLLVIDDFGTADIAPGFMAFFMDLINSRLQWTNRGTVITTNLVAKDFAKYCGDALTDRINTGQLFEFKGKTRRPRNIL